MIKSYLRFVLDQFLQHRFRFLLTISGIVVGVSSLAILASFITVGKDVLQQTSTHASGDDVVTVHKDWRASEAHPEERELSNDDVQLLGGSRSLENVDFAAQYGMWNRPYTFEGKDDRAFVAGLDEAGLKANRIEVAEGRRFLQEEYQERARVALVGATLLKNHAKPWLGKNLRVNGYALKVVGILEAKPTLGIEKKWSWNERIILPASTLNLLFNPSKRPDNIIARVSTLPMATLEHSLNVAGELMEHVLMLPRHYRNFQVSGRGERESNEETIFLVIQVLMYMTTLFSMIVGGINIMNIMLVTVSERTREIGVRRALGATRADILWQFLLESVMLTMTGALVGLLLSVGGIKLLSLVLTAIYYPWPFYVAWWSIGLGIGLTAVIGVIFGLSPAMRASRLDPVEALRFE